MNYTNKNPIHAFTIKSTGILSVLVLDIEITEVNNPSKKYKTKGILDTGASSTVITKEILTALDLKQFGVKKINTATISDVLKPTYLVDAFLKKDLRIQTLEVTVGSIAAEHGIHCLIGMDIIGLGDFSITNFEGKTCCSFRLPSQKEVDFSKPIEAFNSVIDLHMKNGLGFNNPCSCKSGKKFKNCHGKDLVES